VPLSINSEVFITCAVTGSGSSQDRSPHVPRSPEQIANSAIAAAKAGAAIVHCHVRDPETGAPSRDGKLYREVTERIRHASVDVVLNLTAGMGGDMVFGGPDSPLPLAAGTDMASAEERVAHVADCLPEICTLDCGTMNFAEADYVMTNTPGMLRAMGRAMTEMGVQPEIEALCRMTGTGLPSVLEDTRCRSLPRPCWLVAMCVLGWKTTCGWPGDSLQPMRHW